MWISGVLMSKKAMIIKVIYTPRFKASRIARLLTIKAPTKNSAKGNIMIRASERFPGRKYFVKLSAYISRILLQQKYSVNAVTADQKTGHIAEK